VIRSPGHRTRGVSLLSALVVMSLLGFAVYTAGRVVPLVLEYRSVVATLAQAATSGAPDAASLRAQIAQGFERGDVHTVTAADVDVLTDPAQAKLDVTYDAVAPWVGNVGLVIHFHAMAPLSQAGTP